jgi:hypothetical protein
LPQQSRPRQRGTHAHWVAYNCNAIRKLSNTK